MRATTKILAIACAALLSLAGTASAHHGTGSATVYGAKLTGTDPIAGRALLVDGSQNNLLVVKVRNLKPNTAYTFDVAGVSDFAPTTATTDGDGKLKGFAKSATFNAVAGTTYTVEVKDGDTVVVSGDLQQLPWRFGHRGHKHWRHGGFKRFERDAEQSGDPGHTCNGDNGEQS